MKNYDQTDSKSFDKRPSGKLVEDKQDIFGKKNKSLIRLAVKCRLIPLDQENVVLSLLAEKRQQTQGYSVIELFKETGFLSEENIRFLFAVKDHLEVKMLDKKFGELGIANHFIQPKNVKKALDIQTAIFKETNQSKLIGDILLENKEISISDKSSILLCQDRVKDELLAETMNDIASCEIERLSLNMRFGAIAVKKEMITIDQLNQALKVQAAEVKSGQSRPSLGKILKQLFNLSDTDLDYILKIQKELEKKRLALEKALSLYNDETNTNKRLSKQFEYRFSKNKLEAFLQRTKEGFEEIQVPDLITWLNSIGITWGICPAPTMEKFLAGAKIGMEIQIATGLPPQKGTAGSTEFFFDTDLQPSDGEGKILSLVKKGDALARTIPPQKGTPGKDVCGYTIAASLQQTKPLNCGEGVIKRDEIFFADTDGIPLLYENRTLFVRAREQIIPTRHHTGRIDKDLGDKYKDVNLKVEGSISPTGAVRCQGLEINGDLLGQASVDGDARIHGNVGRSGEEQAKIKAEGDILVDKTITNAILVTSKSLIAPKADFISSAVLAYQDIVLKNVSDDGSRASILQTGKNPTIKAKGLDSLIKTQTTKLNQLKHREELNELEKQLNAKLQVKEDFLKQHEMLKYILALLQCKDLMDIASLGEKITKAGKDPDAYPGLPLKPLYEGDSFLDEFLEETVSMGSTPLETHVRETADIKYGMYRAAVNATQRHHHEYETTKKIILEKVEAQKLAIRQKEETIKRLKIQKDTLLLGQQYRPQVLPPAIKVKNKVQKGTVIMGQKARLSIDRDIYGVKFMERQVSANEDPVITIEGFYE
jgi:uncharacterized protein (DUF342 family)